MKKQEFCWDTALKIIENCYLGLFFGIVSATSAAVALSGLGNFFALFLVFLISFGISTTSFISDFSRKYEACNQDVQKEKLNKIVEKKSSQIRTLIYQLKRNTKEKRPEQYLTYLNETSYKIEHLFAADKIDLKIKDTFDRLFELCINRMALVRDLWWTYSSLSADLKKINLEQREGLIKEVGETIEKISQSFSEFLESDVSSSKCELSQLSQELEESLKVAKRTNQRISDFNKSISLETEI